MTKKTVEKHMFPSDWSKISSEEVIEHIKYLLKYSKNHRKQLIGDKIIIGNKYSDIIGLEQATFSYFIDDAFGCGVRCVFKGDKEYDFLETLFDKYEREIKEQKQKQEKRQEKKRAEEDKAKRAEEDKAVDRKHPIKRFIENNAFFMLLGAGLGVVVGLFVGQVENSKREKRIDKQVEQYEQTLPNYQEYQQTKQQIANYRDSLEHESK